MRNYRIGRKCYILLVVVLLCSELLYVCKKEKTSEEHLKDSRKEVVVSGESEGGKDAKEHWKKGYGLPVDEIKKKEAEDDCKKIMELISDIYMNADKGNSLDAALSNQTIRQMAGKVKKAGYPVTTSTIYSNVGNYKKLDNFLKKSMQGIKGAIVVYDICSDGGIEREQYSFDGTDMYVLATRGGWNDDVPIISCTSYTRLKKWKYTDKGWFCYELCVPEFPEVTEMVDGSCLIRVKPVSKEIRQISEKCVLGLDYAGNNLLRSDWDKDHIKNLDYNGMYEYLYAMKYQKKFNSEKYPNGIPKQEFERLIMEYLPVTPEQIRKYAVFDRENNTYLWERLGCFNYELDFFGTSIPEVTGIRKNKDGTVTLTVDAVCEMVLCDDAVITHELTVRFFENGRFQYLGNKILDDGNKNIPDYQYRISS